MLSEIVIEPTYLFTCSECKKVLSLTDMAINYKKPYTEGEWNMIFDGHWCNECFSKQPLPDINIDLNTSTVIVAKPRGGYNV